MGATEAQLAAAEERLGVRLPPSYRSFLAAHDGVESLGLPELRIRQVEEVRWLRDEDPELIEIWLETGGAEPDLAETLAVSDDADGGRALLNPRVVGTEGEWEAWFFAPWVPGAEVHPSFAALVEHLEAGLAAYERAERGEAKPPAETAALMAVVADPAADEDARESAARALGDHRTDAAAAVLLDVLRSSRSVGLKHAARQGLLRQRDVGFRALAAAAAGDDEVLRAEAAQTLCYARERAGEAFAVVAPLAMDSSPAVRRTVVVHVGQLFDPRGTELLHAALADPDPDVRAAAAHALSVAPGV